MSRKLFVAGNWKMNTSADEAVALAKGVAEAVASAETVDVAVCPPLVYLSAVGEALAGTNVAMGAQNMFYEDNGAFTGETSGAMLLDVGCTYAILSHSERRHVIGESDELFVHLEEYWNRSFDDYFDLQKEYDNVIFAYDGLHLTV